jgi:hypothetical protein
MSELDMLVRDAEARVRELEHELAADEREVEKALARAAAADAHVEQWWFGGGRLRRLWVQLHAFIVK